MATSDAQIGPVLYFEFHDSTLESYEIRDNVTLLYINPGYVHKWERKNSAWSGTGWTQQVGIGVYVLPGPPEAISVNVPARITSGYITVGERTMNNLVRVPLSVIGPLEVHMEFEDRYSLKLVGEFVRIVAYGEPTYVEELPQELAPDTTAT